MHQVANVLIILSSIVNLSVVGFLCYIVYKKYVVIKKLNNILSKLQDLSANFSEDAMELLFKEFNIEIKVSPSDCERRNDEI